MKIIIGADIVPTVSNQHLFEKAQMENIIDDGIRSVLSQADYRIFNLEVPLTDTEMPIKKWGPNLIASTKSVTGLKQLGIDFLALANNHILDQGEQGMWSTAEQLDRVGIAYAGIGRDITEAAKPYIVELDGKKVGIYCCAEHEFSIVSEKQAGANPFDPLESLDHIMDLKLKCDYVICLYHGGKEHYRYPSPNLQKTCRKLVEKGADLVVCQHSHCIGAMERWEDKAHRKGTIIYGQGNFLFDNSENEFWQTSLMLEVMLEKNTDGKIQSEYHFIPLRKQKEKVRMARDDDAKSIISEFLQRSEKIQSTEYVLQKYQKFADTQITGYLAGFSGYGNKNYLFRVINKLSRYRFIKWYMNRRYGKTQRLALMNAIECEAHRELALAGLKRAGRSVISGKMEKVIGEKV